MQLLDGRRAEVVRNLETEGDDRPLLKLEVRAGSRTFPLAAVSHGNIHLG
jgi:hypothetical protein